jgi:hypothetical protein
MIEHHGGGIRFGYLELLAAPYEHHVQGMSVNGNRNMPFSPTAFLFAVGQSGPAV